MTLLKQLAFKCILSAFFFHEAKKLFSLDNFDLLQSPPLNEIFVFVLFFQERKLDHPSSCYVCKLKYTKVHHFYDNLCPECAPFNYMKRLQTCNLEGNFKKTRFFKLQWGHCILVKIVENRPTDYPKLCNN